MAGSVKKFGTSRKQSKACYTVAARALGLEPGVWVPNVGPVTYRLGIIKASFLSFYICEMGTIMEPLGLLGGLNEIP